MIRRICIGLLAVIAWPVGAQHPLPPITARDRVVIVAPHPDDEVLGASGAIQQALAAGADVRVVYLTNGDHNQIAFKLYRGRVHLTARQYIAFGELRQREAIAATSLLGLPADHLTFLGYPDWGTLRIWRDYWNPVRPFRSDATQRAGVPYENAFRQYSPYTAANIAADLTDVLRRLEPTRVFVTHPADSNPDHRAAASFTRLAVLQLAAEGKAPAVYFYLVHFGGWTRPLGYHPELELQPPRVLLDNGEWMTLSLTAAQTAAKYDAILQNRTQLTIGRRFLFSLARANELFATLATPPVRMVPPDAPLDWRKAVKMKGLRVPAYPTSEKTVEEAAEKEPEIIDLNETMLLRQGNDLIAQIDLRNRLGKRTGVHLFLYGVQRDVDFATLPKIRVKISPLGGLYVYDNRQRLRDHGVTVVSVADRFFVRVPLRLLGGDSLDHLFVSARAHFGEIPPDDTAWRLFPLESPAAPRTNWSSAKSVLSGASKAVTSHRTP